MRQQIDFIDRYLEYRKETESPVIFHRWSAIAAVSAWLGRRCWFPFGGSRIFPNHYVMFVGDPGTRKSSAIKGVVSVLKKAGYKTFSSQKTSKEKWLLDLAGDDGEEFKGKASDDILQELEVLDSLGNRSPREMFIPADEFNNFIGNGNLEFLSLLGELWDWDDELDGYKYRLKNSKSVDIFQPTIALLAGNTPTGFAQCFPAEAIGQGFMSRMILIFSESSGKKITVPPEPSQEDTDILVATLLHMRQVCNGPMKITQEAMDGLDLIYRTWPDLDDARFKHYSTRRFTHLIKLSIVHAAARCSAQITMDDVVKANTVLAYAETHMPKALGELGKARHSEATNKIMQVLYTAKAPVTVKTLWKVVSMDIDKPQDLHVILQTLLGVDKIQLVTVPGAESGYLPKSTTVSRKLMYVKMDLLKGKEL